MAQHLPHKRVPDSSVVLFCVVVCIVVDRIERLHCAARDLPS